MRLALPSFFRERSNELGDEEMFCLGVTQDENGAAVVASIDSDSLTLLRFVNSKGRRHLSTKQNITVYDVVSECLKI